jgi:hypothetical protein
MRFYGEPKLGEKRHRTGFLFLPKKIGNETRWLEATVGILSGMADRQLKGGMPSATSMNIPDYLEPSHDRPATI